jgi:hypothetical protein
MRPMNSQGAAARIRAQISCGSIACLETRCQYNSCAIKFERLWKFFRSVEGGERPVCPQFSVHARDLLSTGVLASSVISSPSNIPAWY